MGCRDVQGSGFGDMVQISCYLVWVCIGFLLNVGTRICWVFFWDAKT